MSLRLTAWACAAALVACSNGADSPAAADATAPAPEPFTFEAHVHIPAFEGVVRADGAELVAGADGWGTATFDYEDYAAAKAGAPVVIETVVQGTVIDRIETTAGACDQVCDQGGCPFALETLTRERADFEITGDGAILTYIEASACVICTGDGEVVSCVN